MDQTKEFVVGREIFDSKRAAARRIMAVLSEAQIGLPLSGDRLAVAAGVFAENPLSTTMPFPPDFFSIELIEGGNGQEKRTFSANWVGIKDGDIVHPFDWTEAGRFAIQDNKDDDQRVTDNSKDSRISAPEESYTMVEEFRLRAFGNPGVGMSGKDSDDHGWPGISPTLVISAVMLVIMIGVIAVALLS